MNGSVSSRFDSDVAFEATFRPMLPKKAAIVESNLFKIQLLQTVFLRNNHGYIGGKRGSWVEFILQTNDFCLTNRTLRERLEKIGSVSVTNIFNLTEYTSG